jgi:hypothetical protein
MPERRRWRLGRSTASDNDLVAAARREYLTPRDVFGPARQLYGRVHRSDSGIYLLVAPHLGEGDPVVAVGWARNDHWAVRIWGFDGHGFTNDYEEDAAEAEPPSLRVLGWPWPLTYADVLAAARDRTSRRVMVTARYRGTDGAFQSHVIEAGPRVMFHYDDPDPQPSDRAAAVELGLGGPRWEQHLAEVHAINEENARGR